MRAHKSWRQIQIPQRPLNKDNLKRLAFVSADGHDA
jgi:hypothetical protein